MVIKKWWLPVLILSFIIAFQNCNRFASSRAPDSTPDAQPEYSATDGGTINPAATSGGATSRPPPTAPELRSWVDGYDQSTRILHGWACYRGSDEQLKLFVQYPTVDTVRQYPIVANDPSEPAVAAVCGNSPAPGHRFHFQVPAEDVARFANGTISVYVSGRRVKLEGNEIKIQLNPAPPPSGGRLFAVASRPVMPGHEPYPRCFTIFREVVREGSPCPTIGQRCHLGGNFHEPIVTIMECQRR